MGSGWKWNADDVDSEWCVARQEDGRREVGRWQAADGRW